MHHCSPNFPAFLIIFPLGFITPIIIISSLILIIHCLVLQGNITHLALQVKIYQFLDELTQRLIRILQQILQFSWVWFQQIRQANDAAIQDITSQINLVDIVILPVTIYGVNHNLGNFFWPIFYLSVVSFQHICQTQKSISHLFHAISIHFSQVSR